MPTPKMPAAPSGPGVGGTAWWVSIRPPASAMPSVSTRLPVVRLSALHQRERITKALSQKIGIETM